MAQEAQKRGLDCPYQVPGFDESKNLVQAAVVQNHRAALLKQLTDAAVVK
jgi:hypothetical protein